MKKINNPGDCYWGKIECYFNQLKIYDTPEIYLDHVSGYPQEILNLVSAHLCQSEICNGGFNQFFSNASGVLAPEALVGFKAIGIPEWARLLEMAMAYFGEKYPRERNERKKLLPRPIGEQEREDWDVFFHLDNQFYKFFGGDHDRWYKLADKYAEKIN